MLNIRAISNNGVTIAVALEKNAKFSFTIGENFHKFELNFLLCEVLSLMHFQYFLQ